jgi:hypothetical protein
MLVMKVVRLPSGPLACVYSLEEEHTEREPTSHSSGSFRAHSGSLHADGCTEDEALAELDVQFQRVSIPPEELTPNEPPATLPEQSQWAMRVRKCGPQATSSRPADAETPFDGITVPPPFSSSPPSKANDR